MKKSVLTLGAAILALGMLSQSAQAHGSRMDRRLVVAGIATGTAATVGLFSMTNWSWPSSNWNAPTTVTGVNVGGAIALTTLGCVAAAPIVGTIVVHRELTTREVWTLTAGCVVPFVGPFLVNAAYNAHPEWEPQVAKPRRHRH